MAFLISVVFKIISDLHEVFIEGIDLLFKIRYIDGLILIGGLNKCLYDLINIGINFLNLLFVVLFMFMDEIFKILEVFL
jgi:hypothetical protein